MIALELVDGRALRGAVDDLGREELASQFSGAVEGTALDVLVEMQLVAQLAGWAAEHARIDTYAILRGDAVVGRLLLAPAADVTVVVDLLVAPRQRGAGVGTATMTAVVDQVAGPIALTVRQGNRARSLYERLGFAVVSADDVNVRMRLDRD